MRSDVGPDAWALGRSSDCDSALRLAMLPGARVWARQPTPVQPPSPAKGLPMRSSQVRAVFISTHLRIALSVGTAPALASHGSGGGSGSSARGSGSSGRGGGMAWRRANDAGAHRRRPRRLRAMTILARRSPPTIEPLDPRCAPRLPGCLRPIRSVSPHVRRRTQLGSGVRRSCRSSRRHH